MNRVSIILILVFSFSSHAKSSESSSFINKKDLPFPFTQSWEQKRATEKDILLDRAAINPSYTVLSSVDFYPPPNQYTVNQTPDLIRKFQRPAIIPNEYKKTVCIAFSGLMITNFALVSVLLYSGDIQDYETLSAYISSGPVCAGAVCLANYLWKYREQNQRQSSLQSFVFHPEENLELLEDLYLRKYKHNGRISELYHELFLESMRPSSLFTQAESSENTSENEIVWKSWESSLEDFRPNTSHHTTYSRKERAIFEAASALEKVQKKLNILRENESKKRKLPFEVRTKGLGLQSTYVSISQTDYAKELSDPYLKTLRDEYKLDVDSCEEILQSLILKEKELNKNFKKAIKKWAQGSGKTLASNNKKHFDAVSSTYASLAS